MSPLPNNFAAGKSPHGKRVPRSHRLTPKTHTWISANRDWLEREVHTLPDGKVKDDKKEEDDDPSPPNFECPHYSEPGYACASCKRKLHSAIDQWHSRQARKKQAQLNKDIEGANNV